MPKPPQKKDALVKWEARLAASAASATKVVAQVGGGGNFISLKSGVLSYQKAVIPENKMRVIVLAQLLENQYYAEAYEEGQPTSPSCYAYGTTDRKTMKPDPEHVEHPVSDKCDGCENKEFGTADRGKGKACADVMRLAMITEGDLGEIETAEIAYMKIPYFTTLEWAGYVRQLSDVHHISPVGGTDADGAVPPGFITQLEVVPDKKSQFRVKFKMVEKIEFDESSFTQLAARTAEALKAIAFPYPRFDTVKEQPKKGKARR
jgi:hypothetical protein